MYTRLGRIKPGALVEMMITTEFQTYSNANAIVPNGQLKFYTILRHSGLNTQLLSQDGTAVTVSAKKFVTLCAKAGGALDVVGFTGTRSGMTSHQKAVVEKLIDLFGPNLVVHGDCEGADTDFHHICMDKLGGAKIRIRPCNHHSRAWNKGAVEVMAVKSPLLRNIDIVNDAKIVIATPPTNEELKRSGTWHTCREARKQSVGLIIVWPDGSLKLENLSDDMISNIEEQIKSV